MSEKKISRAAYRRKNRFRMMADRVRHPWPIYVKAGGLSAIINHADGSHTDLGKVSVTYMKRWGVGAK